MPLKQLPRLTTTLRVQLQRKDDYFDIEQAYLQRKQFLLHNKRLKTSTTLVGSSYLAQSIVHDWDRAPIEVRKTYEEFLTVISEFLDGEISTEELHESAISIYNILHDYRSDSNSEVALVKIKENVHQLFGVTPSDVIIQKAASLANILSKSQIENNLLSIDEASDRMDYRTSSEDNELEFGIDLNFRAPSINLNQESAEEEEKIFMNNIAYSETARREPNSKLSVDYGPGLNYDSKKVDLRWLKEICDQMAMAGESQLPGDDLAMALCHVLDSDKPGDEVAEDLFDIIGCNGFEIIQKILQHRKELVDMFHKGLLVLKSERTTPGLQPRMPSYGTQVSVQTESGRQILKLQRKEEKRQLKRGTGHESEQDLVGGAGGFSALLNASEKKSGLDNLIGKGDDVLSLSGNALPQGTIRKTFKGYEEVRVPATEAASMKPGEKLIEITSLDSFAQTAFEGYRTLNRIQSRIFPTAYNSNENILVCAPTGAGKTNIAMIAILHEIKQHIKNGILHKNEFKIVYVAPMKALAAEVTTAFSRRLSPLNITVKELTGDMQLSKNELEETQMIVTTPEKWDVITRKSSDMSLSVLVKLLIIDEVHLLNDERGPVIEALVARTLRQVESLQSMIRIVGLSATLPNYLEVAQFLRVNPDTGLFFFDSTYRPVPLTQQYIGVTEHNFSARNNLMNEICYNKVLDALKHDHQAMIFVHSRKDTGKTARILVEIAQRNDELGYFSNETHPQYGIRKTEVFRSKNRELGELFQSGFGIHHAGMLRADRSLTERLFSEGLLKVLVCTATLAWGVNLPAHTVVIKGTQLYDPKAGGWRELDILDVMQIFGRAGRPQFDKSGEGIIITTHDKLARYLRLLTNQLPIESQLISSLKDNLNAEIALGTVTNVREACAWLGYTYFFIRMRANPLVYGIVWEEVVADPSLTAKQRAFIADAARSLDKAKMIRFDEKSGNFYGTELGRIASHFYIKYTSVETYNEMLKQHMNESELINLVAHSSEFENIMVREEELYELEKLCRSSCPLYVRGGPEDKYGKISILIQVYISHASLESFSLIADANYISQSIGRIMRALFEICLRRGWCAMAILLLEYCKAVDRQIWPHQHPLRQFERDLSLEILRKLEDKEVQLERLFELEEKEIGALIRYSPAGKMIKKCLASFPCIHLSTNISPITRSVLQVELIITPGFVWKDHLHGAAQRWWILVEDSENDHIYYSELFILSKKMARVGQQKLTFTVPIFEPCPPQYYIRGISDSWLQANVFHTVSFQQLILPKLHTPHTELLDLRPLPVTALGNHNYEKLYNFSHFNPIQTQAFHILYHTDKNVLLGAPTGSGKTISAELAMLHLFNTQPDMKVIYIAPMKAIVRERMNDWQKGLVLTLKKKMVEMTGDFTPDLKALLSADIIVSTPEKWDGISRSWHHRKYVMKVGLLILDEIHLLGADRGPILEVIVSRMRYISSQTACPIRFVGLSTALANARDLADWLGIDDAGLFNFKPSVRPVPLEVHIQGYPGKNLTTSKTKPRNTETKTKSKTVNAGGRISHSKEVILFGAGSLATTYTALPPRDDDAAQIEAEQIWLESRKEAAKPLRRLVTPDDFLEFHSSNDDDDKIVVDDDIVSEADLLREAQEELAELERIHGPLPDSFFGNTDSTLNPNPNSSENPNPSFNDEFVETENGEDLPEDSGKGVPAVMRCFDRAKIYVKAGDGGDGVVAFRREKYVPFGGPSGGNGGKGGNVYIEVDGSMNSLLPFRKTVHFRAGGGSHGQGKCQDGAKGKDVVVKVAPGTIVRDASEGSDGDVLVELTTAGQRVMVLPGGRGGRGNASFKSGRNKAPQISENGEEGAEMWLDLELKLVADVGIVGIPNAGKSTFLSAISAAQPTIANYPFTTLLPNLGVVSLDYDATMVVADLPGLLEGAHRGFGLGHEFLRHTERCHVLVHVVDGTSQQPEYEFDAVRLELDLFSPELAYKPYVVAYNKMDIPEAAEHWKDFKKNMQQRGIHPFCMSAATTSGTMEVVYAAYELLKKQAASIGNTRDNEGIINNIAEMITKKRSAPLEHYEITYDNERKTWCVDGAGLQRFTQMTNWEYFESVRRFQHVLEACGVDKSLRERGVKEGDTVIVGQMELVWHDSHDASLLVDRGKFSRGSSKWPH